MPGSSDLSIDEVLLLEDVGFRPVKLVTGFSFFHIDDKVAWRSLLRNQELAPLSNAMANARGNALRRLTTEAEWSEADGIVGTRIEIKHHGEHAEFLAIGTAVRRTRRDDLRWRVLGRPFTSGLSGQDFWALVRAGWRPCELVMGVCVYHVAEEALGAWLLRVGKNVEMPSFTQALYEARELAMARLGAMARGAGGQGVVGVTVHEGNHGWQPHVMEFSAMGTAIARLDARPDGPPGHLPIVPIVRTRA